MASMFSRDGGPSVLGESFLSKKVSDEELSVWGKEGYQRPQSSTSMTLNQALKNLSTVADNADPDKAVIDMVHDVFCTTNSLNERSSTNENDNSS